MDTNILLENGTNELEVLEFKLNHNHYGINVAKLAKLPDMIIDRSTEILKELEQKKKVVQQSMPIFTVVENKNEQIIDILKEIDVNQITPMNALNLISDLKEKIK